ncbi:MAG: GlsB/YeaQ/YmgE family stress response membrane protein [Ktedonobacterales bacterium]|nr:GlsB/YeaQ/YmgE family stress response membrane protein [Ktedonobacterales bacterium]
MVFAGFTVTFSDLALEIIAGAIAAGLTGRAMTGGGYGLIGDLLFGAVGALVGNFIVGYFGLFNLQHYGLLGELIVGIIFAILLVVIVHLLTGRRANTV